MINCFCYTFFHLVTESVDDIQWGLTSCKWMGITVTIHIYKSRSRLDLACAPCFSNLCLRGHFQCSVSPPFDTWSVLPYYELNIHLCSSRLEECKGDTDTDAVLVEFNILWHWAKSKSLIIGTIRYLRCSIEDFLHGQHHLINPLHSHLLSSNYMTFLHQISLLLKLFTFWMRPKNNNNNLNSLKRNVINWISWSS